MKIDRRDFLALSASGLATGLFSSLFSRSLASRALYAGGMSPTSPKKLVVIFLRGGNDGVNTVIPHGDSFYNTTTRPTLFIPDTQAIDLGNNFAYLHPAMTDLNDVYTAGDLAVVHRVGYQNLNRSHFEGQHFWENAKPGDSDLEEGWLYRHAVNAYDFQANPLAAASVSSKLMLMLRGAEPVSQISRLSDWEISVAGANATKILGGLPGGGSEGAGLLGAYGRDVGSGFGYTNAVGASGVAVASTLSALEAAGIDPSTYVPQNGASYPSSSDAQGFPGNSFGFFAQVRDAAQLLKETDLRVVGLEWTGFDTHSNQGTMNGSQADRLRVVARAVKALSQDLQSTWDDTLVMTMSEFGRTSEENGSFGTDHGEASCMFVAGGAVNGGVYNCDSTTWLDGDLLSTSNGRYVAHRTDFRAVIGEVLDKHLGVTSLQDVIPNYTSLSMQPDFASLGILP